MEKQLLKVQHAGGQVEVVCPKCDVKFAWVVKGNNPLDEVEIYCCPNCGMDDPPVIEERECWPRFFSTELFAYRCPECFGRGKAVSVEEGIGAVETTYSCLECDSFWKVIS